jgi:SdpC family antimicrobial peptide
MGRTIAHSCLALCVSASIVGAGCDNAENGGSAQTEERRYEGETIFDGVFFGVGPAGGLLTELVGEIPDDQRAQMDASLAEQGIPTDWEDAERGQGDQASQVRAEIKAWIAAEDPTFFARFGDAMQSGDHFEVDAALDEALDLLDGAVASTIDAPNVDGLTATPDPQGCGLAVGCVVAIYVAGFSFAAVHTGVVLWYASYFWSGAPVGEANELGRERIVDVLTNRLALAH